MKIEAENHQRHKLAALSIDSDNLYHMLVDDIITKRIPGVFVNYIVTIWISFVEGTVGEIWHRSHRNIIWPNFPHVASKKPHEKRRLLRVMFWDGKRLPIVLRHYFKRKLMVKNLFVVVFKFVCLERFLMSSVWWVLISGLLLHWHQRESNSSLSSKCLQPYKSCFTCRCPPDWYCLKADFESILEQTYQIYGVMRFLYSGCHVRHRKA